MQVSYIFDKDSFGILKQFNGGYYRFRTEVHDDAGKLVVSSFGWRIASNGMHVLPPQSITQKGGIFTMGAMDPEHQLKVIEQFRIEREASDNIRDSKAAYENARRPGAHHP